MNQDIHHPPQIAFTAERLERYVADHLSKPKIKEACDALVLSRRTLQRRLHEAGTSFQKVVIATRITIAKKLLQETNEPVTQIATDVGFATLQAFSSAFRRETGVSPSGFRNLAHKSESTVAQYATQLRPQSVDPTDTLAPASGVRNTNGEEAISQSAANG